LVGYAVEELIGRSTPDFYDRPEDREAVMARVRESGSIASLELPIRRRDGERIWCLLSSVNTAINGEPTLLGGLYDISRRRRVELRVSEERFRGLVEHSRGITYSIAPDGRYTYLSPSFTELLGYGVEEYIGKPASEIVHPEDRAEVLQWAERAFASGEVSQSGGVASYRLRRRDGRYLWISTDAALIRGADGSVQEIIGVAHDITGMKEMNEELAQANHHLKETQTQLVQSEKMASLGMLVAGIAHEINTPIGAVNSMHDTLMRAYVRLKDIMEVELCRDTGAREQLEPLLKVVEDANSVIKNGTERVMTIVRRLRSFARLDEAELKTVDIHEGLEATLLLIHHEIKNRITVERDYGDVPAIACYPGRLNQVFLNLLNNARQAIVGEGTIRIGTRQVDGRVRVSIADTGRGIAPGDLKRVFDPGFTTKGVGIGTGLGLSICWGIMADHHGTIEVQSTVGQGSTFTLVLPMDLEERVSR
jgi:PAS domain S-box-containing protein